MRFAPIMAMLLLGLSTAQAAEVASVPLKKGAPEKADVKTASRQASKKPAKPADDAQALAALKPGAGSTASPIKTSQRALFDAIAQERSSDVIAQLIKLNLDAAVRACPQVSAYQIFRYSTGERTLKVKCAHQPIYALRVTGSGEFMVHGGDGTVTDMLPSDGRVYTIFGAPLRTYAAQERAAASGSPNMPPPAMGGIDAKVEERARMVLIGTGALAIIALLFGLRALFGQRRNTNEFAWGLNSMDKDMLMDESREIYPNVFKHPRGFFIARGRQGKRRLFRSALGGMLYRDLGLKIGEVGD
jgi:hypothetical protein